MLVETFECAEILNDPTEANEEALELIEKLGLEGQKSLISKGDEPARSPYREMTKDERVVYGALCPARVKLKEYRRTPIPLRVLQVAAHAESLGMFKELVVLDAESAAEKDPVLVGVAQTGKNYWETTDFILARWGEELETFSTLVKRACEKIRAKWLGELSEIKTEVEAQLSCVPDMPDAAVLSKHEGAQFSFNKA